jgi:uncharacterized protein (DUF427 family)
MPTPNPTHRITLEPGKRRWRAAVKNHVIADSDNALILREAHMAPVVYFPRADVAMEYMGRTERHTHCPFKGEASYYTLTMNAEILENVAWSYEEPIDGMEQIAGRIAFYPGEVELYEVDDAVVNPHHRDRRDHIDEVQAMVRDTPPTIDEVIQHTDAGDGTSQRPHWTGEVEPPREGGVR